MIFQTSWYNQEVQAFFLVVTKKYLVFARNFLVLTRTSWSETSWFNQEIRPELPGKVPG